ncbi:redoxin domain-containing protein [Pelagicoccus sp. SDUM812005]|uniref:redoxin domain-containing protein n=1 Tax=Pelagicoccus sp. SDUM812005 TaxID=3041257 RepID=UPI00280DB303|nr:redoxin domain-containing protein [Pelagicoccus sp. SDUM812005]MDQ8180156.1 redoxin domain-containing protein [Pelagicoccus sp. SDUM812005]
MKRPRPSPSHLALFALIACSLAPAVSAQRYSLGDIVEDFSLVDRATNQPVSLSDFEGKIVFLEWFAYWCPFCQAAAEQIETGIVGYYKSRGGNQNGVPVMHVGINLEDASPSLTQQFINRYGMQLVLNDFDANLARRFQPSGQPIFAIINGVANSPSHQQWELAYSRLGYGDTTHPISEFRAAIETIQAAPQLEAPNILSGPQAARLGTGSPLMLAVQATGQELSYQWKKDGDLLAGQTSPLLQIPQVSLADSGSYLVEVSNRAGLASSDPVAVQVVLSLEDFLANAGLAGEDLLPQADPDFDGFANALEYLALTNPNDRHEQPDASFEFLNDGDVSALRIQFASSAETIGYQLTARFWSEPPEAGAVTRALALGIDETITQTIPAEAKTYLARLQATPSP